MTGRRVALVTGASRGLGAAVSAALARDGTDVAINYLRDGGTAEALQKEITTAGGRAALFRADVTDEAEVDDLYRRVVAAFGGVDVLVLNATGPQPDIPIEELRWQDVLDQLDFFVKSPLLLTQKAIAGMKQRGFGRIVHVGSDVVDLGPPQSSAYVAAKAAQLGLTRSWARELGRYGITVNLVAPGWIPTDRHEGIPAGAKDEYAEQVPLGHFGVPTDVAEAVAFLASDRAAFITGQRITVNGGNTLT
ncbi:SDR family NAD(P)-dependent oxidoreductase [Actinomadura xylanilytica]|uniref:SDR family NAD(P)-dependent oxidoreductase n=1 Tax=Actinomadura xylanilytica TaxID=887459 RepID=UPI00255AD584|nr:SDR family oxidoreductase [Actinomadura xylanilytica]MDL4771801.1 SDR family oxidoreductase [Actinomadura xylanilytica]